MEQNYEGRCMGCKKQVPILDAVITKTTRGVNIAKGHCATCGTKVCRIIGKDKSA